MDHKHFLIKKKKVKEAMITTTLNKRDSLIIDYFYRNPNQTIVQMTEDINICKEVISRTISNHLNM